MKNKIKNFIIDLFKFLLTYIAFISTAVTIYVHVKFNMVSVNEFHMIISDILYMEWALEQIKIFLILLFLLSFFISWYVKTKYVIIYTFILLLLPLIEFDVFSYFLYRNTTTTFFEENYVAPQIEQTKKNNLIIVYLESFEDHFATEEISPFLANLKKENTSFMGFKQLKSTYSTIYAQYASMCGVPIKQNPDEYINFAPRIPCISDLLKQNGYNNAYLKAADIGFSRANYFAKQHNFDEIKGLYQLKNQAFEITPDYLGNKFGGLRDKVLFEIAKEELKKLKEPFFISITTLDMHATPFFYYDPDCEKKFGDVRDAAACTSKSLEDFINWLKKQPYWKNTTLVVMGDHRMNSRYLTQSQPLNIFVNSKASTDKYKRNFTTYDLAPTILEAMGYKIEKFGIGRSLFNPNKTLLEEKGDKLTVLIDAKNNFYNNLKKYENTDYSYAPYKLGSVFNNETLLNTYTDFGEKNDWCNKIVTTSMTLDKVPEDGVYLKLKYLKMSQYFRLSANDVIIHENIAHNQIGFINDEISIHLPKSIFNDDKKLVLKTYYPYNNMNNVFGLCIKEFVIDEKK